MVFFNESLKGVFSMGWLSFYLFIFCGFLIFMMNMNFGYSDFHYVFGFIGVDSISFWLIVLSFWIIMLMMITRLKSIKVEFECVLYMLMIVILAMVFLSVDFLMMYFMFELVLIPTYVLIMGWGYQPEKISSSMYLLFYTVFCSLPLLVLVIFLMMNFGVFDLILLVNFSGFSYFNSIFFLLGVMAFLVKLPLFGVHLWLPKAHVEAPVSGSMILAGILLKLGGYGLMRFMMFFWLVLQMMVEFLLILSLFGGLYLALLCLRQTDLKALIAYSSVVHMGMVVGGIISGYFIGWLGSYVMMVGHGLCSSGLFYYANMFYWRVGSRSMMMNSGMMLLFPSSMLFWFFFVSMNMSFPPSMNFVGEILIIMSLMGLSVYIFILVGLVSFFGGIYCLYMYSFIQHGNKMSFSVGSFGIDMSESLVSFLHLVPLSFLFLIVDLFNI